MLGACDVAGVEFTCWAVEARVYRTDTLSPKVPTTRVGTRAP